MLGVKDHVALSFWSKLNCFFLLSIFMLFVLAEADTFFLITSLFHYLWLSFSYNTYTFVIFLDFDIDRSTLLVQS